MSVYIHYADIIQTMCTQTLFSSAAAVPDNPYPVQLVDGASPNEGRLQIYYNNEWGTVCDDHWTISEATVVCHSLGFPGPDPTGFLLTGCVLSNFAAFYSLYI